MEPSARLLAEPKIWKRIRLIWYDYGSHLYKNQKLTI